MTLQSSIYNYTLDPHGTVVGNVRVIITLSKPGFRVDDATEVLTQYELYSDLLTGFWSAGLERNSNIYPPNTYYVVEELIPVSHGGTRRWQFTVGATNPQSLRAALRNPLPAGSSPAGAITQAQADARYVQIGSPVSDSTTNIFNADQFYKSGRPRYDVAAFPGADPTGGTFSDAAYNAAVDLANLNNGIVWWSKGSWKLAGNCHEKKRNVSIGGDGSNCTTITHTGNNICFPCTNSPFSVEQQGTIGGFKLIGNSGASAYGFKGVDVIAIIWHDLAITGYLNGACIWFDAATADTGSGDPSFIERHLFLDVWLGDSKILLKCTNTGGGISYGFNRFLDLRLNVNAGQTGIQLSNTIFMYNSTLTVTCNMVDAGTLLELKDTSTIQGVLCDITGEQTQGTGGIGIKTAAGTSFSYDGLIKLDGLVNSIGGTPSRSARYRSGISAKVGSELISQEGTIANWGGSGSPATPIFFGTDNKLDPLAAIGMMIGANVASPFFACFNANGNGIDFYRWTAGALPTAIQKMGRINNLGTFELLLAGAGIDLPTSGPAARAGVAQLSGGQVTINTTAIRGDSIVLCNGDDGDASPAIGAVNCLSRSPGVSMLLKSTAPTDTQYVSWVIINPSVATP